MVNHSDVLGRLVIAVHRLGHWTICRRDLPVIRQGAWVLYRVLDLLVVRIAASSYIPARCTIGPGLRLPHTSGIIIHGLVRIGADVTIFHQVTVGLREHPGGVPIIGDGVVLGAGAKVLGPLVVHARAKVGANAVVLADVPVGCTAVGVPATVRGQALRPPRPLASPGLNAGSLHWCAARGPSAIINPRLGAAPSSIG